MLLERCYVKRVNDSTYSEIHNTFSNFTTFFIVAVTKRFNADNNVSSHVYFLFDHLCICDTKETNTRYKVQRTTSTLVLPHHFHRMSATIS